jgi:hypothetical protein
VEAAGIFEDEAHWPYQVALVEDWKPDGVASPLAKGSVGVLIRLESDAVARIDFGRDGLYEVPVGVTDLVARIERARRDIVQPSPNFVTAISARLLDPSGEALAAYPRAAVAKRELFLCVIAGTGFAAIWKELAPIRERDETLILLLPQGEHPDDAFHGTLRDIGWSAPFVYDHLAEAYARILLGAEASRESWVLLQSPAGKVLYRERWSPASVPRLIEILELRAAEQPTGSTAEDAPQL